MVAAAQEQGQGIVLAKWGIQRLTGPLGLRCRIRPETVLRFVKILSRRSSMDLSRINSMAAVRCEFRPEEELRIMSDTKAPSTEGFSLDWKSSCSISLIRLWLCGSYVGPMGCRESWND
jgi:hypothetical protein